MNRILIVAALAAATLASPAAAAAPTFAVGASAVVLPGASFAPKPIKFRAVYRVGLGVYCVAPVPSLDWTKHTALVAALPDLSARRPGAILAAWEAKGQHCPAAAVQVRTLRVIAGRLQATNDVAFHILIGGGD